MKKILLIDDDINLLESLNDILTANGYDVTAVNNSGDALDNLKKIKFDLIVSDIMVFEKDDISIMVEYKKDKNMSSVPTIFISGMIEKDFGAMPSDSKSNAVYLAKPFEIEAFLSLVRKVLKENS